LKDGGGLRRLEAVGRSPEDDLDAGSVLEVLDGVVGYLGESAEEELGRPEVGEWAKLSFGYDAGDRGPPLALAGGLAGDGERLFHQTSVAPDSAEVLQHSLLYATAL